MRQAKVAGSSDLSLPPESFVYTVRLQADTLVASCSDDSLRIVDKNLQAVGHIPRTHDGLTSLAVSSSAPHAALTGGRDGHFKSWDIRTTQRIFESSNNSAGAPISAIAVSPSSNRIAVGTELTNHQAAINIWDPRALQAPVVSYVESHSDDVTELSWHPTDANFLLSGSTDGLLNLYDTRVTDEDEAVVRTWNHGSVSHAAWTEGAGIQDGHEIIYATSHNEQLGLYRIPLANEPTEGRRYKEVSDEDAENEALTFGDVRPKFDCEYVVDFLPVGDHMVAGVGKHSARRLELVDLNESLSADNPSVGSTIRIDEAHGEELVRSFVIDGTSNTIFTGGEDGMVRSWSVQEDTIAAKSPRAESIVKSRGSDKKSGSRGMRYAPY